MGLTKKITTTKRTKYTYTKLPKIKKYINNAIKVDYHQGYESITTTAATTATPLTEATTTGTTTKEQLCEKPTTTLRQAQEQQGQFPTISLKERESSLKINTNTRLEEYKKSKIAKVSLKLIKESREDEEEQQQHVKTTQTKFLNKRKRNHEKPQKQ